MLPSLVGGNRALLLSVWFVGLYTTLYRLICSSELLSTVFRVAKNYTKFMYLCICIFVCIYQINNPMHLFISISLSTCVFIYLLHVCLAFLTIFPCDFVMEIPNKIHVSTYPLAFMFNLFSYSIFLSYPATHHFSLTKKKNPHQNKTKKMSKNNNNNNNNNKTPKNKAL